MSNKLWIDDIRYPPDVDDPNCWHCCQYLPCPDHWNNPSEWEWVKTYEEAVEAIQIHPDRYEVISFDNDLGLGTKEGYQIANWLEEQVYMGKIKAPKYYAVHSANPVAASRIRVILDKISLSRQPQ